MLKLALRGGAFASCPRLCSQWPPHHSTLLSSAVRGDGPEHSPKNSASRAITPAPRPPCHARCEPGGRDKGRIPGPAGPGRLPMRPHRIPWAAHGVSPAQGRRPWCVSHRTGPGPDPETQHRSDLPGPVPGPTGRSGPTASRPAEMAVYLHQARKVRPHTGARRCDRFPESPRRTGGSLLLTGVQSIDCKFLLHRGSEPHICAGR